ncbi:MAG: SDR family NAD(P)-dependent oxidoreductase [Gammaproteobacteria bacterium]|nr:SDR family NAD(P)-dependent oxidoreductase [Gammaproteobacteria bacterium]
MSARRPVALGVAAGDGIGAAFARRFAEGGYTVAIARRDASKSADLVADIEANGGTVKVYSMDARDEQQSIALFDEVERDLGPIDVCLFNGGANSRFPIQETSAEMFTKIWTYGCFAGFIAGREAARYMVPRGKGTILFTGATASLRGGPGFAGFAAAKFGLRAVAQSMARELGPMGIHVAHLIVDGGVDSAVVHALRRSRTGIDDLEFPTDSLMRLSSVGEAYWNLSQQTRDAWTHELDIRPFVEKW